MPFYSCSVPAGSLTDDQKNDLAYGGPSGR
jgi:phenylpyruvate tautomerase PptA (4-oxalocrotonate tautomerase family)